MKILFITIVLLSFPIAHSQELNEDFLKTLPKSIQKDVIDRAKQQGKNVEPKYSSAGTQTKLEKKELEDLKIRLEKDLEYLKDKLSEDQDNSLKKDDLTIFGSDFFRTYQSTFMPINEPNLSSKYILDFGDSIEIQLIGQEEYTEEFLINRDGSISMPDIGKLNIAGLSLGEAISLIKAKVNSSYIGTEVFITLSNLRDINVLVSGNAFNSGIYTLSGNSNMLHAIGIAGGINDYGSYREINLIRNQEVIDTLDMYDVLITGIYSSKTTLKSGDIIFVEAVKNIISVDGAIKRPAKYELNPDQNLSDVLEYANGIDITADMSNIYLDRIIDGKVNPRPIKNIEQFNNILANDGDKVFIRKHSFRSVNIEGAVLKPGRYLMAEGESIEDLLEKAGGYSKNAYPFGAIYENKSALLINKMAEDILYEKFIDNIITSSQKNPAANFNLSSVIELTESLEKNVPNGRIVIDIEGDSSSVIVKDGDRLIIPEKPNNIYIYGEVSYEGALNYYPSKTIDYYISKSGGLKDNADDKAIYVLHPNGNTQRSTLRKSLFQNSPDAELMLYPGSIIFIPKAIDNSATTRLAAQAYVSILGNIGIALASLSSINNNINNN
jgi:protein involved in polysaccharide export with SLBB domain